jgi:hypothetical protein
VRLEFLRRLPDGNDHPCDFTALSAALRRSTKLERSTKLDAGQSRHPS